MTDTENKSRLLRIVERREERLATRGPWPRRAVVLGSVTMLVAGTGVAVAAWTANGTGVAAATAGTASGVNGSVTSVSTSGGTLLTPGNSVPAVVNVHNPNAFAVKVSAISISAAAQPNGVSGANNGTTCTAAASGVSLNAVSASSLSVTINAGEDAAIPVTGGISMAATSDNGCQNATFTFPAANATVTAASA